ncbi:MAG: hypothetical protein O7B99_09580 [Planctomycetota bacterium]|nr:hypothetical protein [Planctomycetota bacterium]
MSLLALLPLVLGLQDPFDAVAAPDGVALVGGMVHSMIPGEPGVEPRLATVLIREGRFEAVLDAAAGEPEIPPGMRRIDVAGLHLVPGLIDGMVYFDPDHDALYVSQGVTVVRDIGGNMYRALAQRLPAQRERVPGPWLLTPGKVIDGDPPASSEAAIFRDAQMVDAYLPILFSERVDFLSIQRSLGPEPFARLMQLANEEGYAVWGPVPTALDLQTVLQAGLAGVTFMDELLPPGVAWEFVQPSAFDNAIELMKEHDAALVPAVHAGVVNTSEIDEALYPLELLAPSYASWWRAQLGLWRDGADESTLRTGRRVRKKRLDLTLRLHEEGVPIVPGSAAGHPWLFPGRGLHDELALLQEAGIPAAEILHLVTRGAAERLRIAALHGAIAPGMVADVVCVAGDPRQDVAALRDPAIVVVRGHVLERRDLDDRVAALAARMAEQRELAAAPIIVPEPTLPAGAVVLRGRVDVTAMGERKRAERYAVVREPDGALAFCGRTVFAATDNVSEMEILQRVRDGQLEEFFVTLRSGDEELVSHGVWTAETFRVQRRSGGRTAPPQNLRGRVTCVDIGSVTTLLLLSQLDPERPFSVVTMHENLEPEVATWALRYGPTESGIRHDVRTHKGYLFFFMTEKGSISGALNMVGQGAIEFELVEEDALGGPGLPLSKAKRQAQADFDASLEQPDEPVEPSPEDGEAKEAKDDR